MRFLGAGGKMGFGPGKITFAEGGDRVEEVSIGENNYILHFFETVGQSSFDVFKDTLADVLIVAGGGGGGGNALNYRGAGGGGAGGVLYLRNISLTAQNYTVVVGKGGTGGDRKIDFSTQTALQTSGKKGDNSQFWTYVAEGGGGGAGYAATVGYTGGSGGGNRAQIYSPLASGVPGQGTTGGKGANAGQIDPGGGGGGASGPGLWQDYIILTTTIDLVSGGSGKIIHITGVPSAYGGGGGFSTANTWTGLGGTGGGGDGGRLPATTPTSYDPDRVDGKPGLTNTGGGGGAGCGNTTYYGGAAFFANGKGGNGGSGIVIVRYPILKYELWTPSDLAGLDLWFDVSQETPQSDDTEMTSLTDFSGNGRDLTAYGATKPKYRTNLLNGLPGVKFTGAGVFWTGNWQIGNFPKIWSPVTFSSVFNLKSGNANTGPIVTFQYVQVSPSVVRFFNYGHNHTYSNAWAGWRNYFGFNYPGPIQPYVTTKRGSPGIYTSTINASGVSEFRENGTALTPGLYYDGTCSPVRSDLSGLFENACASMSLTSNSVFDGFAIGGAATNTSTPSFTYADADNYFYEVVYYNAELSVSNRQKLEGYLAHKWGLTNNLPSDHPYKYEPPYR